MKKDIIKKTIEEKYLSLKDKFTEREVLIYIHGFQVGVLLLIPFLLRDLNIYFVLSTSLLFLGYSIYHFSWVFFRLKKPYLQVGRFGFIVCMISFTPILIYTIIFILTLVKLF